MDIPPFLKISSNLLKKVTPSSSCLKRTNGLKLAESLGGKPPREDHSTPKEPVLSHLEGLLNLDLDDSVNYIGHFLTNSRLDSKECLIHNLNSLSNEPLPLTKLKSRDVKIIAARILSFDDLISHSQLAKLIFALTNSDLRLYSLVSHLIKLFVAKDEDGNRSFNFEDYLYSNFLVLSSLIIFKRNVSSDKRRLIGDSLFKKGDDFENSVTPDFGLIEAKLLSTINTALATDNVKISNEESLLFLKMLTHTGRGNEEVVKSIMSYLDLERMTVDQMCSLLHTYSLLPMEHEGVPESFVKSILEKVTEEVKGGFKLPKESFPQMYHFFYMSGELEHELLDVMTERLVSENMEFPNPQDFYRVSFPLAVRNAGSNPELAKWILNQLATKCETYMKDVTKFLFVLMSSSNSVKLEVDKKREDGLIKTDIETDIYEKALIYLNESERGTYFPSERSALLYLFERAIELVEECDNDQFIQLIQAFTHKLVKRKTSMKLRLLKECKNRVNRVSVGGILQILQFGAWIHGNKNPDLVELFTVYLERILSDITTFNVGDHSLIEKSTLYRDSFLTDAKSLANVLYFMDWSNLYSEELSKEVSTLISRDNYKMLVGAEVRDLAHIIHYIALSSPNLGAFDPLYIILGESLGRSDDLHARDLIMIIESMIANSSHTRHRKLLDEIENKARSVVGPISTIETLSNSLSRLTETKYTWKDNGTKSCIIQLNL